MLNLEAMVTAVTFIEGHLQENIKVADVADAVSYSLFHFCRTFHKIVHHSPYDYLMRRRLSESARLLSETDHRITDIAFAFQFNSLETYSRAFRRLFGQLPREWKKGEARHAYRTMPPLTRAHLMQRNRADFERCPPLQQEQLSFCGLMSSVATNEQTDIAQLWATLAGTLNQAESSENEGFIGLQWLAKNDTPSAYFYMAGIQSPPVNMAALVMKEIPEGMYGRFRCPGPFPTRQLMIDYILHTWLPQANYELAHPFLIEQFEHLPVGAAPPCWEIAVPIHNDMISRR